MDGKKMDDQKMDGQKMDDGKPRSRKPRSRKICGRKQEAKGELPYYIIIYIYIYSYYSNVIILDSINNIRISFVIFHPYCVIL